VIKKEVEKVLKYKNLIEEIQPMWNVVIVWTTGAISESLRQYVSNIPRKLRNCKKQATLATAHTLREVLM
jgi:hypothetical protein